MGHFLWDSLWIRSCLRAITECRSVSHNLIITWKVPDPHSTEKLILQKYLPFCLWSIRITCLICNYLLLKSVTISLWDKMPGLPETIFFSEEPVSYSCHTPGEEPADTSDLNPSKSICRSVSIHCTNLWDRKHNRRHKWTNPKGGCGVNPNNCFNSQHRAWSQETQCRWVSGCQDIPKSRPGKSNFLWLLQPVMMVI